jgi:hypothetical protein
VEIGVSSKLGKAGRKLSYVATVQGNGNLLVGKAYTAMLDLHPGDEFEIKLGRKQIRLIPAGSLDDGGLDDGGPYGGGVEEGGGAEVGRGAAAALSL